MDETQRTHGSSRRAGRRILFIIAVIYAVSGCAVTPEEQLAQDLKQPKEYYRAITTIKDSALDTAAAIETDPHSKAIGTDSILRCAIDKETGIAVYGLLQIIQYQSSSWRFYRNVNVATSTGPRALAVTVAKQDVECYGSGPASCTYTEQLSVDLDESLLRKIAAPYNTTAENRTWQFKFSGRSGEDYVGTMPVAMIQGFLERVDEYQGKNAFNLKQKGITEKHR